jgi:hypothetical protein
MNCMTPAPRKRADEQADPRHTAQRRERPGPQPVRHDLGEVRLPSQTPYRGRQPLAEDADGQHPDRRRGNAQDQACHRKGGREQHRPSLPDPDSQHPGLKVGDDPAHPANCDDLAGRRHRGAELACGECDGRCDRPLADAEQERRKVDRWADGPEAHLPCHRQPSSHIYI